MIALLVIGLLGLIGCTVMLISNAKKKKIIRYRAIGLIGIVVSFILIMIGAVGSFGTPRSPSSTVAPSTSTGMLSQDRVSKPALIPTQSTPFVNLVQLEAEFKESISSDLLHSNRLCHFCPTLVLLTF